MTWSALLAFTLLARLDRITSTVLSVAPETG